jgi:Kelch motif
MAGTWKRLTNSPNFNASTMLLLTDGSVMCQQSGGVNWSRLTSDANGDYINGTWTPLAPMINTRLYFASAVLRDGRVIVCGGEYSNAGVAGGGNQQNETNRCEIYNPVTNVWTALAPPAGWTNMGDAPACLLPDGRLLVGYYDGTKTAIYDPLAGTWSAGPNKGDSGSEETWTLLADGTVLTVQCSNRPWAEKYVVAANQWVTAGQLPVDLVEAASIEIGPAVLLPDGRVFCVGATGHSAIYTPPPIANQPGTWKAGPDFNSIGRKTIGAKDAPCCLMPNGKVLLVAGPVDGQSDSYLAPTYFFEFDGGQLTQITGPNSAISMPSIPYQSRMMLLPTGQVLFAAETNDVYCYTPDGAPNSAWQPTITGVTKFIKAGYSYTLFGRQLNGLSQAVSYGDDCTCATNYPIIRIRHVATGNVFYCRTFDHSTIGVATGATIQSTNFKVPANLPLGDVEITVVANGIASPPLLLHSWVIPWPREFDFEAWSFLIGSRADSPLWVWGPNGPMPVALGAKACPAGKGSAKRDAKSYATVTKAGHRGSSGSD